MNRLEYYNRQKEPWEMKELQDLKREYVTNELSVIEIADIHRRTPGAIACRLKRDNVIVANSVVRGYSEYKISNLYNEIVGTSKSQKSERVIKREAKLQIKIEPKVDSYAIITTSKEINELKDEVSSLKKDVKEILRLMNALYEFESQ
jgi:hypothetical protein